MGEISGKYADLSVITSDNPRDEELDDIMSDILVGIAKTNGKYTVIKDRRKAIHYALSNIEHIGTHSEGVEPNRCLVIDYID
jgi:UDP-N-acetylmuramoyl-L-alanyl-D-glutamate--2,6-diaminopimelate ligase